MGHRKGGQRNLNYSMEQHLMFLLGLKRKRTLNHQVLRIKKHNMGKFLEGGSKGEAWAVRRKGHGSTPTYERGQTTKILCSPFWKLSSSYHLSVCLSFFIYHLAIIIHLSVYLFIIYHLSLREGPQVSWTQYLILTVVTSGKQILRLFELLVSALAEDTWQLASTCMPCGLLAPHNSWTAKLNAAFLQLL